MPVTQIELDSFHRFASEKLGSGESSLGWDDLFLLWDATCHRDAVNAAIHQGLDEVDRGDFESADVAMDEIRAEFGLPR
jgi:hypothetical protein